MEQIDPLLEKLLTTLMELIEEYHFHILKNKKNSDDKIIYTIADLITLLSIYPDIYTIAKELRPDFIAHLETDGLIVFHKK